MDRRSILTSLLTLPALGLLETDGLSSHPNKWTCPYCKTEFEARILYTNHRTVRFFTPGGEYVTCSYEVGRKMIRMVNCQLVKEN